MLNIRRHYVASGSYHVGRSEPMILEAALGTCVGVAIYDSDTGIGGLIHLLLSEPTSLEGTIQPGKYASTGLPIFLKKLLAAGASRDRMEAIIAGGALVGPVEDTDLALDIGGRTVDIVLKLLAEDGIPIGKSETGGFFTCLLQLNMQTWESHIEPVGFDKLTPVERSRIETSPAPTRIPTPQEIRQVMQNLQPIPQVALKILRIISTDHYDIKNVTDEIRKDQVIGARTLKLCNSAMFGSRNRIESLDHAWVFLGQKLIVKFVISAAVNTFFNQVGMGYSLCKGGIYHHAVGTAIIAEILAKLTGNVRSSLAYTAGLLHDIGKVILDQYITLAYPFFYRQLHEEKKNAVEVEKKLLSLDHTEVGGELAETWSLPESLVDAIRFHHRPEDAGRHSELVHIVYLADLLMSRFHTGLELERLNTGPLASRLAALGLSLDRFADIVDFIPLRVLESTPEMALMESEESHEIK